MTKWIAALTLVLASPAWTHAASQPVRLCVTAPQENLLAYAALLAKDNGFFREEGLDVTIDAHPTGTPGGSITKIMSQDKESCSVGIYATEDSIGVTDTSLDSLRPLMVHLYGISCDAKLVVSKKSGVRSVRDLKGKTIRLGHLATSIALKNILAEEGLAMDDVSVVMTPVTEVLNDMESGRIVAAITFNPSMAIILASGDVGVLRDDIFKRYVMPAAPQAFLSANEKFADAHPDITDKLVRGMEKAAAFLREDPSRLIDVFTEYYRFAGPRPWPISKALAQRSSALLGDLRIHRTDVLLLDPDTKKDARVSDLLAQYRDILARADIPAATPHHRDQPAPASRH